MTKRILLLESDPDSLSLLKEILEEKGHTVFGTILIENAFDILGQGVTIDLIMISTYLEHKENYNVFERFQEHRLSATIPLCAIAQSTETSEGPRALKQGCVAFITKPVDEETVEERLNAIFNRETSSNG